MRSSSPSLPSEPLLLDEGLGTKVVASALRAAGATVIVHRDEFEPGTPDQDWLRVAGAKGWVVLGKDRAIRRRHNERQAVIDAKVKLFTLTSADLSGEEMARAFVLALPRIARVAGANAGPFTAAVYRDGRVKLLH